MPLTDDGNDAIFPVFTDGNVALYTVAPTTSTPGTEVSGGAYSHIPVTLVQDGVDNSLFVSTGDLTWGSLPACDVVAIGHFDSTDSTLLFFETFPAVHFDDGDPAVLAAGQYVIDLS